MRFNIFFVIYFVPFILSAQINRWSFDTTWVIGEGENYDLMISQAGDYFTDYSQGKVIISGHAPNTCGSLPYLFIFNAYDSIPVARPVPFLGFPENKYRRQSNGALNYTQERITYLPERNRIIWNDDLQVTLTDTNFNYIKHFQESYEWRLQKDNYYYTSGLCLGMPYYIRFLEPRFRRKNFQSKKRAGISRYGKLSAPGLKSNQFAGIGLLDLESVLDARSMKIKPGKVVMFQKCDSIHSRWFTDKYALHLGKDSVLWFIDDHGRNLVRYDLTNENQKCFSLMNNKSVFLPNDQYDILPQEMRLNDRNEYDFNKMDYFDFYTTIHHTQKGRVGIIEDYYLFVDEAKDVIFRKVGITIKDSTINNALQTYIPDSHSKINENLEVKSYNIFEFRKLSTMAISHVLIMPSGPRNLLTADSFGFTMFEALWDGDNRKWALIRVKLIDNP